MDSLIDKVLNFKSGEIPEYQKYLMIAGGSLGPSLVRGKNIYVWDIDGKEYIDCTSQAWTLSLGYSHPELNELVKQQLDYSIHFHTGFQTIPRFLLAKKISEIFPEKINRTLFTVGGGASIEAAMKIAIINRPKAHNFIALYGGFHGTSFMCMGADHIGTFASGNWQGGAKLAHHSYNFIRVPAPYYYRPFFEVTKKDDNDEIDRRCLEALELQIRYGSIGPVCGLLMEPLQASGGQIIFSKNYLQGVRDICTKYGIILIWDCIQTAFGRMGDWSAANYYSVTPDIMVIGKSMGAGFPINAVSISDDIEGVQWDWIDAHTFGNNQVSQMVALKQIEIIERDNILNNVGEVGAYLKKGLMNIQKKYPAIGDIRQVGLHIGVEFIKDPETRTPDSEKCFAVRAEGVKNGILFGHGGSASKNILKIKPPLITTKSQADVILEKFELSMEKIYG